MLRTTFGTLLLVFSLLLQGCATTSTKQSDADPFEKINRGIYAFNATADKFILRPVAKGYNTITPKFVRRGVGNFFDNLTSPIIIVNDFLQADFNQGFSDTGRLLVNTTIGLLGLFDPAEHWGMEQVENDFGKTLAVWGAPQGPYLMLPILGPATIRSGTGMMADSLVNPLTQWNDSSERGKLFITWFIQERASLVGPDKAVYEAYDPYLFVRDAYLQSRQYLIEGAKTGDTFEEELEDF